MGIPPLDLKPMTVEDFLAFTDTRPDEEKWELIDGEPVLNATPSHLHQRIVGNIMFLLAAWERQEACSWEVIPGIGVRVSDTNLPQPDLLVRPKEPPHGDPKSRECDDIIVAFEVLSPSTRNRDLRWKRSAYLSMPSVQHYVVIAQDAVEVVAFGRAPGVPEQLTRPEQQLELAALGLALPLAEIYRGTEL
jgi:Uma2 family endonuclease